MLSRLSLVLWMLMALLLAPLGCAGGASPGGQGAQQPSNSSAVHIDSASAEAAEPAADGPEAEGEHLLWTVESETATVHLLGSIHVGREGLYPLDEPIQSAFDASDVLVLEIPLDAQNMSDGARKLLASATYPKGDSLKHHLSPRAWQQLTEYLEAFDVPPEKFKRFKPWFVALTLVMLELKKQGIGSELGLDRHFQKLADERDMPVEGIETLEEQLALFDGMKVKVSERMLLETIERMEELPETMDRTYELWQRGDAAGIDELMLQPLREEYPQVFARLFTRRNERMADSIEGYLKTDPTYFVVVGSGHLVGPEGIVAELRRRGHTVRQR